MTNTKKEKYRIEWESWKDPYGENINDVEWPGWNDDKDDDNVDEVHYNDEFNIGLLEAELAEDKKTMFDKPLKAVVSPMGLIPLTEYSTPSKVFNFWVGHTNFRLTHAMKDLLDTTDGVETLEPFTDYRIKIGIAKLFRPGIVCAAITKSLRQLMINKDIAKQKDQKSG